MNVDGIRLPGIGATEVKSPFRPFSPSLKQSGHRHPTFFHTQICLSRDRRAHDGGAPLCAALLPTWYVATQRGPGAPPIKQAEAQFLSSVRFVVIILPLLAITGLIIAIGFPYPTDLGDHPLTQADGLYSPLAGSVFCLGWVLIMSMIDGPVPPDTQNLLLHAQPGGTAPYSNSATTLIASAGAFWRRNLFIRRVSASCRAVL